MVEDGLLVAAHVPGLSESGTACYDDGGGVVDSNLNVILIQS
jgi:hypothetical protein